MAESERPLRLKLWLALSAAFATLTVVAMYSAFRVAESSTHATLASGLWSVGLVVLAFGLLLATAITTFLAPSRTFRKLQASVLLQKRVLRGALLEMIFVGLVTLVVASAAAGIALQQTSERAAQESLKRVRYLELVRTQVIGSLTEESIRRGEILRLRALASSAGLAWNPHSEPLSRGDLMRLARTSEEELRMEAAAFDSLYEAANGKNRWLLTIFGLAVFLSLGALVLLRISRQQEGELEKARVEAARQQAIYQQIADNLPIGFYTYSKQQVETSNAAWDRLVHREEGEPRWEAFLRSLHPEDSVRVQETFAKAEQERGAFGLAHRLTSPDGNIRHVETRGVSVHDENGPEHIVGFLVDISSRVRAQRLLEEKNKEVQATNERLRTALAEIESNFEAMVNSLVKAVEAKDPYTAGHSERVMLYSLKIGDRMGLNEEEMRILKMGCLVHDLGKIGIPDAVLTKPARLTDEEFDMIKQHPVLGYRMIQHIPTFSECLPIVLHHHERLDGGGYPHGLKGLEIPLLVRICTVSDCFDAMTSDRAYRKGLDPRIAVEELYHSADRKVVDRHIVGVLEEIVEEEGIIAGATSATIV